MAGNPDAAHPPVVDRSTFEEHLERLRVREKAHTREGDAIAAARRRLPMAEVAGDSPILGPDGPTTLLDAFEGRRQLIVYYFMWWPAPLRPGPAGRARALPLTIGAGGRPACRESGPRGDAFAGDAPGPPGRTPPTRFLRRVVELVKCQEVPDAAPARRGNHDRRRRPRRLR